jgi:hypothetical protein
MGSTPAPVSTPILIFGQSDVNNSVRAMHFRAPGFARSEHKPAIGLLRDDSTDYYKTVGAQDKIGKGDTQKIVTAIPAR